jgi:hypothetical protein
MIYHSTSEFLRGHLFTVDTIVLRQLYLTWDELIEFCSDTPDRASTGIMVIYEHGRSMPNIL